jgi:hypothetical protein
LLRLAVTITKKISLDMAANSAGKDPAADFGGGKSGLEGEEEIA